MQFIKTLLRPLFLVVIGLLTFINVGAQTTIATSGFTNNNGFGLVTFNFRNNNASAVMITDIASIVSTSGGVDVKAFFNPSAINGAPGAISSANGWTQFGSATITGVANTASATTQPFMSGLTLLVPAGATYGIAVQAANAGSATGCLRYSTIAAGTYTFSGGGCDVVTGTSIGYAGDISTGTPPANTPRGFMGSVGFVTAAACSGTPAPGNTVSSVTAACPGTGFTLSLQNALPFSGLTYQWQSASSAAGPWSTIVGATGSTYIATQSNATFYRCNVTCSGNTGTSTAIQVGMNLPINCYCAAGATSTSFEKIARVRYNQIDNSSTSTAGYENFLTVSTPAYLGATSPITINLAGGFSADQSFVWIDFNQNGNFSDPGELVYTSGLSAGPHIGNITIPATALQGNTRMRVRMHDSSLGGNSAPCGTSTYGQVEDYTVNIQVCVPVTYATQPASSSITCGGNATFAVTANGSAPVYGWQFRVNASSPWQDLVNGGIYAGATTNTITLTNVLASYNGYQYRALLSGACAALDYSQPATLTVNPPAPVVLPASASICNGTIQALTITNSVSAPVTGVFAASAGLPLTVTDNNTTGVTNAVAVSGIPAGVVVTNVAIKFNMTHTWVGDLVMNLKAPNGQTMNLIAALNGGTGSNGTANFTNTVIDSVSTTALSGAAAPRTGTFRADKFTATIPTVTPTTTNSWLPLLSTLNGNWTLGMCDIGAGDIGVLTSWEIQITYVAATFAQGVWTASPASPNTMFTDAAATVAYTGTPATTIYVKPTVNTNYSVSFSTPTPCQSAVTTVPVSVSNPVTGLAVAPATRAVCLGGSTTFSATITGGSPVTYQWERSTDGGLTYSAITGATSTTLTVSGVTQNMTGYRYRVVATAAPCGTVISSNVGTLTVNALPVVTISSPVVRLVPGRTTTITASSTPAAAPNGWSWTYNGGGISGTTNTQVVGIDQLGTYQATVVDVNGCTNKSNQLVIAAEATDKLWIYPNPTVNGAFQVRLYFAGELAENRVVTVYNPLGQVIESKAFTLVRGSAPYQRMDFNLGGGATAKGAYVVKVAHLYTGKVVSGIVLVQ